MIENPIQFADNLARIGISIPARAKAEHDTYKALKDARYTDHAAVIKAEAATGKITAKNAGDRLNSLATELTRVEKMQEAYQVLQQPIVQRWYVALREAESTLMGAMEAAAADALLIVQEAGRHFAPGARPDDILAGGSPVVLVYEQLDDALNTLDQIRSIRAQLADLWRSGEQDVSWWIAGASDAAELLRAEYAYYASGNAFHNLAFAGFTLAVNDSDEAARVRAQANQATTDLEAAELNARVAEHLAGMPAGRHL